MRDGPMNLRVVSVENKEYPDNTSLPIWEVERTNRTLAEVQPLWGLIAPEFEKPENLSTVRKESFWLPGGSADTSGYGMNNIPGTLFSLESQSHHI